MNEVNLEHLGKTLVTGGAGFIGSHLVENLILSGVETKVIDNFSSGKISNLDTLKENQKFSFVKKDLNDSDWSDKLLENIKTVFHLAADPEVRSGYEHPEISFRENIQVTFNLLEEIRKKDVDTILFTSSSTVYGEPNKIPTPEDYGPCIPISQYGASKLAAEALLSSYCHNYGINAKILRLANIVGSRSNHGIIWDFMQKLKADDKRLEVLGDGKQSKSYLHVSDCVKCMLHSVGKVNDQIEIFNVGNVDEIDALSIAKIVCKTMGLQQVEIFTKDGLSDGRGWMGDVKKMNIDISKLVKDGWEPHLSSIKAIEQASQELSKDIVLQKN